MHQLGFPFNVVAVTVSRWRKGDKLFPALCVYNKERKKMGTNQNHEHWWW